MNRWIIFRSLMLTVLGAGVVTPVIAAVAAKMPTPWSFARLGPITPPAIADPFIVNEVDAFVLAKLRELRLTPSPPAGRAALIRRLLLDVWGLPPTPEQVAAFVADMDPRAWEKLVDMALASPHYGQRWARHWLDVLRFAETHGFETNQPRPAAWPYRDWVIEALNNDLPYDQFIFDQLAGDSAQRDAATGYLVAGPWDEVKGDPVLTANQRQDELHDMINTTSTAFLGLTLGCARCHDHKFDPISARDYYAFQAVFQGVSHGERTRRIAEAPGRQKEIADIAAKLDALRIVLGEFEPLAVVGVRGGTPPVRPAVSPLLNVDRFAPTPAKFIRFTVLASAGEPCIDELEILTAAEPGKPPRNVALASAGARASASGTFANNPLHKLEHIHDGRFGNERSWISNQAGAGWIEIELSVAQRIDTVRWSRDRNGVFADRLAVKYRIETAVMPGQWTTVANFDDRAGPGSKPSAAAMLAAVTPDRRRGFQKLRDEIDALENRRKQLAPAGAEQKIYGGTFTQPGPTFLLTRGDPMTPSKLAVGPDGIAALGGSLGLVPDAPEQQRRIALARWIASPENPLTPRVLVNRIWQHHFGTGIVQTPSDFGNNGVRPTHPELLDFLANRFIATGYSMKSVHRHILLSATYQQSSAPRPDALAADAACRFLWRYPPRRLEAEPIRDSILAVSGALDLTMGGPGWSAFQDNTNYVRVYNPRDDWGPPQWRRAIYQTVVRMRVDGVFGAFDCPDAGQVAPKRTVSTTALQALNLFNSTFIMQQSDRLARRLKGDVGDSPSRQVRRAFALAYSREPTAEETELSVNFIKQQGLTLFCRALLNSDEFVFTP